MNWDLCFHRVPDFAGMKAGVLDFVFYVYCDASHADDPDTSMSSSGYYIFLGNDQGAVFGKTFAPKTPSLSSTEAEYVCASEASRQGVWVKMFLEELGFLKSVRFEVMEDSQPCINALRKSVSDSRFRHVRIYYHYLRDIIRDRFCAIVKIGTGDQTADLATKLLPASATLKHSKAVLELG